MALKAQLKWIDGMQFIARSGNSPAVVLDSHEGGSGPRPMEMFLLGVAGFTAMDVISIMQKSKLGSHQKKLTIHNLAFSIAKPHLSI